MFSLRQIWRTMKSLIKCNIVYPIVHETLKSHAAIHLHVKHKTGEIKHSLKFTSLPRFIYSQAWFALFKKNLLTIVMLSGAQMHSINWCAKFIQPYLLFPLLQCNSVVSPSRFHTKHFSSSHQLTPTLMLAE